MVPTPWMKMWTRFSTGRDPLPTQTESWAETSHPGASWTSRDQMPTRASSRLRDCQRLAHLGRMICIHSSIRSKAVLTRRTSWRLKMNRYSRQTPWMCRSTSPILTPMTRWSLITLKLASISIKLDSLVGSRRVISPLTRLALTWDNAPWAMAVMILASLCQNFSLQHKRPSKVGINLVTES